jgi:hypothetical protein
MSTNPYLNKSEKYFWRSAVADKAGVLDASVFNNKFDIDKSTKIATAGSCFAQHIGKTLRSSGYNVLDYEPPPKYLPIHLRAKYGFDIYSARYGNIYTSAQLFQIAKEAFGLVELACFAEKLSNGKFIDYLRPSVEPLGFDNEDDVYKHRQFHLQAVKKLFLDMDVFVFTLGLTECWGNSHHKYVYPIAPGVMAGCYDENIHNFINLDYEDVLSQFLEFRNLINSYRSTPCKFILTVSPVPLTATFTDDHVMVATVTAKSILRAVAAKLSKKFDDIAYFPSYELIVNPWSAEQNYDVNLRSVKSEAVSNVMNLFMRSISYSNVASSNSNMDDNFIKRATVIESDIDIVVCEEAVLEAFRPGLG